MGLQYTMENDHDTHFMSNRGGGIVRGYLIVFVPFDVEKRRHPI
jgi:hypothetical protein